jgi:hypothetical protein
MKLLRHLRIFGDAFEVKNLPPLSEKRGIIL